MIDVGIEIAAMTVDRRLPRNSSTTSAASTEPTMRCSWTLSIEASMNSPWSRTMRTAYPDGSVRSSSASRAFTPFTIATVFMPDCFRICNSTVGSPLTLARVPESAMPSSMRATSRTSTGWPATSRTTTSPNSAGDSRRPRVRIVIDCVPCSIRPPGTSLFCAWSARDTSLTVRPWANSCSASSHTFSWR